MSMVPNVEPGAQLGVNYYFRRKKKKLKSGEVREYIYLVKVVCENGRCRQQELGNLEEIEKIVGEYKGRNPRPYTRKRVADPGGFEPPTTGLGGRRSVLAELRVLPPSRVALSSCAGIIKVTMIFRLGK